MDKSSGTLMAVVALARSLAPLGSELTAQRLLPLLCPLLVAPTLSVAQRASLAEAIVTLVERTRAAASGGEPAPMPMGSATPSTVPSWASASAIGAAGSNGAGSSSGNGSHQVGSPPYTGWAATVSGAAAAGSLAGGRASVAASWDAPAAPAGAGGLAAYPRGSSPPVGSRGGGGSTRGSGNALSSWEVEPPAAAASSGWEAAVAQPAAATTNLSIKSTQDANGGASRVASRPLAVAAGAGGGDAAWSLDGLAGAHGPAATISISGGVGLSTSWAAGVGAARSGSGGFGHIAAAPLGAMSLHRSTFSSVTAAAPARQGSGADSKSAALAAAIFGGAAQGSDASLLPPPPPPPRAKQRSSAAAGITASVSSAADPFADLFGSGGAGSAPPAGTLASSAPTALSLPVFMNTAGAAGGPLPSDLFSGLSLGATSPQGSTAKQPQPAAGPAAVADLL